MIEISISRELANAHPGFMAGCAQRGHGVNVFDSAAPEARPHETAECRDAPGRRRTPLGVSSGDRTPGSEDRTALRSRRPGADAHRSSPACEVGAKSNREEAPYGLRQA